MKITFEKFQRIASVDNRNMDNVIREYINESANACVISTFNEDLFLLDTINEEVYTANYAFDPDTLNVIIENFEKVEFEDDDKNKAKVSIKKYLLDEDMDSSDILDDLREAITSSKEEVAKILEESRLEKEYGTTIDFEELSFINEGFEDLHNEDFFEEYKERLITNPLPNILAFNWDTPVAFTIRESSEDKLVLNSNLKEKAKAFLKTKEFREQVREVCRTMIEDVEDSADLLFNLFEDNQGLFTVDKLDLKEAFFRAILGDKKLQSNHKQLFEGVSFLLENDENIISLKEAINIDDEVDDDEDDKKEKDEDDDEDEKKEKKPSELTDGQKETLIKHLDMVAEKSSDDKVKDLANELKVKIEDAGDATKPEDVKEAVRFLSI